MWEFFFDQRNKTANDLLHSPSASAPASTVIVPILSTQLYYIRASQPTANPTRVSWSSALRPRLVNWAVEGGCGSRCSGIGIPNPGAQTKSGVQDFAVGCNPCWKLTSPTQCTYKDYFVREATLVNRVLISAQPSTVNRLPSEGLCENIIRTIACWALGSVSQSLSYYPLSPPHLSRIAITWRYA